MPNETQSWEDCLQVTSITDVGMRRSNNQDSHVILMAEDEATWHKRGHLFVVADGMGAHAAGELASKLAAEGDRGIFGQLKVKGRCSLVSLYKAGIYCLKKESQNEHMDSTFSN